MFKRFFNWIKRIFKPVNKPVNKPVIEHNRSKPSPKLKGKFIDISHWVDIDFSKLPIKDVIMKATEGTSFIDSKLRSNISECEKYDKRIGFYHYYRVRQSPRDQAMHFINTIGLDTFKSCYHLPVIDIELGNNDSERALLAALKDVKTFAQTILELTGRKCRIYTNDHLMDWFKNEFTRLEMQNLCDLPWIARYPSAPKNIAPWDKIWAHQYTENGKVKGSNDKVDLNKFM